MSDSEVESAPWSNRRWFLAILLILSGQVGLMVFLTKPPALKTEESPHSSRVRMVSGAATGSAQIDASLADPTFFAMVHPQGFSGAAWLRPVDYPYRMINPMHPPIYLAADPGTLAGDFMQLIQTSVTAPLFVLAKLAPAPAELSLPEGPLSLQPSLRIEGELVGRSLVSEKILPPADPERILTNCVVSIVVAPNGNTLTATLRGSSGSTKVDEAALAFSRAARFMRIPLHRSPVASESDKYLFGSLVFQWLPESTASVPRPNP